MVVLYFEMKGITEARCVQGVEIARNYPKKLLHLYEEVYIKKVLENFWILNSKPINTPAYKGLGLSID